MSDSCIGSRGVRSAGEGEGSGYDVALPVSSYSSCVWISPVDSDYLPHSLTCRYMYISGVSVCAVDSIFVINTQNTYVHVHAGN